MAESRFRDLRVWQDSTKLALDVYRLTRSWPKDEIYGLTQQIRRAAVSIPSNIAEGNERKPSREYLRHLSIALGSRAEVETQLYLAVELNYSPAEDSQPIQERLIRLGQALQSLYDSIKRRID